MIRPDLDSDAMTHEVLALVDRIKPLLAGRHPSVQGAVVADLAAIFVACHHLEDREDALQLHVSTVREIVKEVYS